MHTLESLIEEFRRAVAKSGDNTYDYSLFKLGAPFDPLDDYNFSQAVAYSIAAFRVLSFNRACTFSEPVFSPTNEFHSESRNSPSKHVIGYLSYTDMNAKGSVFVNHQDKLEISFLHRLDEHNDPYYIPWISDMIRPQCVVVMESKLLSNRVSVSLSGSMLDIINQLEVINSERGIYFSRI